MGSAEQLTLPGHGARVRPVALSVIVVVRSTAKLAAREVLLILLCLGVWSVLPAALGAQVTTVMSDSMAPGIRAGDVVASQPIGPADLRTRRIAVGRVLLVEDPDHPARLRLHRWVGERDGRLVLQGDANQVPDSSTVTPSAVRAAGFLRVPFVGLPTLWLRTGHPMLVVATGASVLVLLRIAFPGGSALPLISRFAPGRRRRVLAGAGAALTLLAGFAGLPQASWAVYSKTTTNGTESLKAGVYDCPARTGSDFPTPSLYYSYMGYLGTAASTSDTDLSGNGYTARIATAAMRRTGTCGSGSSPYITLTTASTYVYQALPASPGITSPNDFGISAWFRTTTAGGKIAGFGNKGSGNSTVYDRHVYMASDGRLTFGVQTGAGPYTPYTCTTAAGTSFADGNWHLVVATFSSATDVLTMWTDDGQPACTATATGTISSYSGYWQFGNDTLATATWPNASSTSNFVGDLDETGVYGSTLTLANERAVFAVGH